MRARDNPFSTTKVEQILRFAPELNGTSWEAIERRWSELAKRASLVGPHGAGKTTFIDAFALRLRENGASIYRIFLNTEKSTISSQQWTELCQCHGNIVVLDGEEQLSLLQRRRFYRLTERASGVLISRHSEGKLPRLLSFQPTIATLETCVRRLAPEHYAELSPYFETWWLQRKGNIREILLRCYDHLASQC